MGIWRRLRCLRCGSNLGSGALCGGEESLDVLAEFAAGGGGVGGGLVGAEAKQGRGGQAALGTRGCGVGELRAEFGQGFKVGLNEDVDGG